MRKHLYCQRKLKFKSESDVENDIKKTLEKIGLSNYEITKTYYMDKESLTNALDEKKRDAYFQEDLKSGRIPIKSNLSEYDGCYVFDISFKENGITLSSDDFLIDETWMIFGSRLRIFYDKTGIVNFNLRALYDIKSKVDSYILLKENQLIDIIIKKYKDILMSDSLTLSELELIYLPISENKDGSKMSLKPVWRAKLINTSKDGLDNTFSYYDYFNAKTGEEIII